MTDEAGKDDKTEKTLNTAEKLEADEQIMTDASDETDEQIMMDASDEAGKQIVTDASDEADKQIMTDAADEPDEEIINISRNGYFMIAQILLMVLFGISLVYLLAVPESISAMVWIFISIILMIIVSIIKN